MKLPMLFSLMILAGLATGSLAGMYKWVDENGQTVYSQSPPASGQSTRVKPPPPPAETPEEARQRLNLQLQKFQDKAEDIELAGQKEAKEEELTEVYKSNCAAAQNNLFFLESNPRKLVGQPDGTYVRLTEEERQQKMQEAREQVEKYCK